MKDAKENNERTTQTAGPQPPPPNTGTQYQHQQPFPSMIPPPMFPNSHGFQILPPYPFMQYPMAMPYPVIAAAHPGTMASQFPNPVMMDPGMGGHGSPTSVIAFDRAEAEKILLRQRQEERQAHLHKLAELEAADAVERQRELAVLEELAKAAREKKEIQAAAAVIMYVPLLHTHILTQGHNHNS